jgi:hypothetical protein
VRTTSKQKKRGGADSGDEMAIGPPKTGPAGECGCRASMEVRPALRKPKFRGAVLFSLLVFSLLSEAFAIEAAGLFGLDGLQDPADIRIDQSSAFLGKRPTAVQFATSEFGVPSQSLQSFHDAVQ